MAPDSQNDRYRRDKERLLRELALARKLREIRGQTQLKEWLAPKWWETLVGVLQFAAALGLLASVIQYPPLHETPLGRLIAFWMVLMILSLVLGFEFLILKLYHLRRTSQVAFEAIEHLEERIKALEKQNCEAQTGSPDDGSEPSAQ